MYDIVTGSSSSVVDYAAAAVGGAIAASGIGTIGAIAANAVLGGATYLLNCGISDENANAFDLTAAIFIGGVSGAIGGSGANGTKLNGVYKTSKEILETACSPKKIAMYSAKIKAVTETIIESTIRTVVAGLFSNGANMHRKYLTDSAY